MIGTPSFLGINLPDVGFRVSSSRQNFVSERWLRRAGQAEFQAWPRQGSRVDGSLSCDNMGCLYQPKGLEDRPSDLPKDINVVALVSKEQALKEDCNAATIVISLTPVRRRCPSARLVIDRFDLWRHGAHAVWLEKNGPRVVTAADIRGQRPWSVHEVKNAEVSRRS